MSSKTKQSNKTAPVSTDATVDNTSAEVIGTGKAPGRPVNENSARQQRLIDMEAKRILNGGTLHRGRPVNAESARQKKLASKDPNAKPGRPAMSAEQKAKATEEKKIRAAQQKEAIAAAAKAKLAAAGLLNEDGSVVEGTTQEKIKEVLSAS